MLHYKMGDGPEGDYMSSLMYGRVHVIPIVLAEMRHFPAIIHVLPQCPNGRQVGRNHSIFVGN
jgi:hypothetical protein